ncbi:hypothetical protein [Archangium violaceum]|nr:hypothetical protein [Archangium violaceum]
MAEAVRHAFAHAFRKRNCYYLWCMGRFWFTPKRLMWQPRFGEPV